MAEGGGERTREIVLSRQYTEEMAEGGGEGTPERVADVKYPNGWNAWAVNEAGKDIGLRIDWNQYKTPLGASSPLALVTEGLRDLWTRNTISQSLRHTGCDNAKPRTFKKYFHKNYSIGLSCNECLAEWVTNDFVKEEHRGEKVIQFGGNTYYSVAMPEEAADFFEARVPDMKRLAKYIAPGDHITYSFLGFLRHHAIVIDVQSGADSADIVTLIHWQGGPKAVGGIRFIAGAFTKIASSSVVEENVDVAKKGLHIYRCDYTYGREGHRFLIIARAKAWVGEMGYNLTEKNCEHFAVFCKTGWHKSFQGEFFASWASWLARKMILHKDEPIDDIPQLSVGDQIAVYKTPEHPRCHMIVTRVDVPNRKVGVIRFGETGVVEENLRFPKPHTYRVVFNEATLSPDEVIKRAREYSNDKKAKTYNILTFNCKHFAFLCKTGQRPWVP